MRLNLSVRSRKSIARIRTFHCYMFIKYIVKTMGRYLLQELVFYNLVV